ncbi:MAG: hypothetical protein ABSG86_28190 [Thermoguttaceae bacterium]|jgi:hypothetical protein
MNARRLAFLLFVVAGCLLGTGCDDSKSPLSDPGQSKPDPRLAGVWRWKHDADDVLYYHVAQAGGKLPASVMWVVLNDSATEPKQDALGGWPDVTVLFPTVQGKTAYLNFGESWTTAGHPIDELKKNGWKAGAVESYSIFKYRIEGDTALVWGMDEHAIRRAIEAGKIKGETEKSDAGDGSVRFTDTTENVARFVAAAGDGLFEKQPLRLERVKQPSP